MTHDRTSKLVSEFGWIVEPLAKGGVRLRTRVARRMASVALLLILMLLLAPFACWFYFLFERGESLNPPDSGVFGVVLDWIIGNPLVVVAIVFSALVLQIAWLFLVHEEWFVRDNLLEIRNGIFGIY